MKHFIPVLTAIILLGSGCTPISTPSVPETSGTTEAKIPTSDVIDLSEKQLTQVPNSVFDNTGALQLDVSNNQLTGALPAEIRHLQNLRVLKASNNSMTGVPAEIGQLSKLEVLDLSNNQLTGLPYELGNLQNLKTLNLSGNNVSEQDLQIILEKLPGPVNVIR